MRRKRCCARLLTALVAVASACAPMTARAATLTWSATGTDTAIGGTGTWDTTNLRWTADGSTWSAWDNANLDVAWFGGTAGTVTLTAPITANGLTFETAGYTVTGGTLTLAGATPTITTTMGVSSTTTIASILAGSAGLVKTGSGALLLSGVNTLSGAFAINQGTVVLGNSSALGTTSVTVASGGALDLAGFSASGRPITISGTGMTGYALYTSNTSTAVSIGALTLGGNASLGGSAVYSNQGGTGPNGPAVQPSSVDLAGNTLTIGSNGRLNLGGNLTSGTVNVLSSGIFWLNGTGAQTGGT